MATHSSCNCDNENLEEDASISTMATRSAVYRNAGALARARCLHPVYHYQINAIASILSHVIIQLILSLHCAIFEYLSLVTNPSCCHG